MQFRFYAIAILLAIGCLPVSSPATTISIEVSAFIDGRDQLILKDNTIQWHHFDYGAVGRWGGRNDPTTISIWVDGQLQLDSYEWIPDWPEPVPSSLYMQEAYSSVFNWNTIVPRTEMQVELLPIESRGTTSIVQLPNQQNDYTIAIEFDDNLPMDFANYTALINLTVPEPATLILFGLGGLLYRVKKL